MIVMIDWSGGIFGLTRNYKLRFPCVYSNFSGKLEQIHFIIRNQSGTILEVYKAPLTSPTSMNQDLMKQLLSTILIFSSFLAHSQEGTSQHLADSLERIDSLCEAAMKEGSSHWYKRRWAKSKVCYERAFKLKPSTPNLKEALERVNVKIQEVEVDSVCMLALSKGDSCRKIRDYTCAKRYFQEAVNTKRTGWWGFITGEKVAKLEAEIVVWDSLNRVANIDLDTLNQTDSNGCKQGYWVSWGYNWVSASNTSVRSEVALSAKESEGKYVNGLKEGRWLRYTRYAKPNAEETYEYGQKVYLKYFFKNGCVHSEGPHINSKWRGPLITYGDCNCVKSEENYNVRGKKDGIRKIYYADCESLMKKDYFEEGRFLYRIEYDSLGTVSKILIDPLVIDEVKQLQRPDEVTESEFRAVKEWNTLLENVTRPPTKDLFPKKAKNLQFNRGQVYTLKDGKKRGQVYTQTNPKKDKAWIYDFHFGWKLVKQEELDELRAAKWNTMEDTLIKIFKRG